MKRKLSRALALMLSLVMLLTLFPTAAFAAGEEEPAFTEEAAPAEEPAAEEEAAPEEEPAPEEEAAPIEEPIAEEEAAPIEEEPVEEEPVEEEPVEEEPVEEEPVEEESVEEEPVEEEPVEEEPVEEEPTEEEPVEEEPVEEEPVEEEPAGEEPVEEEPAEEEPTEEEESKLPFGLKGMPEGFQLSEEQLAAKKRLSATLGENGIDAANGNSGTAAYSPDEVIIKADTEAYARTVAEAYNGELLHFSTHGIALIRVGTTGEEAFSSTNALQIACDLENNFPAVEPNYIATLSDELRSLPAGDVSTISATNDPRFSDQWHHDMVQSSLAWGKTTGSGIKVAVLDTAIDATHSDLTNVTIKKMSDVTGYSDTNPLNDHGTHVAGIIGAVRNNGKFGCGVAPGVTIYGYNVLPTANGEGSDYMIAEAFYRAADAGANIINCSFGSPGYGDAKQDAVNYALNKGATIIAAAGNECTSAKRYPAAFSGVVAVAAVGPDRSRAWYSNYGSWVDLAAPGGDGDEYIWSCAPGNEFVGMQGTSQATPVVSGCAALYMAMYGVVSPGTMRTRLINSCLSTGDSSIGAGIINVPKLLLTITTNPASKLVKAGTDALFTAAAKGAGSLSYQWQYRTSSSGSWNNSPASGNTTASLTVPATASRNGYQYRCVVTDTKAGISRTSSAATLTVLGIATEPASETVAVGGNAVFKVKATGSSLKYQWQYRTSSSGSWKDSPASGNTTASLTVPATMSRNGYQYRCKVSSGSLTVTSKAATLTVTATGAKPVITTQPSNKTAAIGGQVTFNVVATGGNLSYQWQVKKVGSSTWTNCTATGYNTATYKFSAQTAYSGRQYRCVVKNSTGSVNSNAAKLTVSADVAINGTTFPDGKFRSYVKGFDTNGNSKFSPAELSAVEEINVYHMGISSLKGVEFFTRLQRLYCEDNSLTALDVSKNTALTELYCDWNNLTSLDVSKNTALRELVCYTNGLTSLNVSKNTALECLDCSWNNLTSLNVSKNTALELLSCEHNTLSSLDLSKNTALRELVCYTNGLTSLNVSKNTALEYLDCSENALTSLSLSNNAALEYLDCSDNELTGLSLSNNTALRYLYCNRNALTGLSLSNNTALVELYCWRNALTSLNVSKNTALEQLDCSLNDLRSLDISKTKVCKGEYNYGCFGTQSGTITVKMTSTQKSIYNEYFADDPYNTDVTVTVG